MDRLSLDDKTPQWLKDAKGKKKVKDPLRDPLFIETLPLKTDVQS